MCVYIYTLGHTPGFFLPEKKNANRARLRRTSFMSRLRVWQAVARCRFSGGDLATNKEKIDVSKNRGAQKMDGL